MLLGRYLAAYLVWLDGASAAGRTYQ